MMTILLVDDKVRFATTLTGALRHSGYTVTHAPDARTAVAAGRHDLVLLDLTLSDRDGLDLLIDLRRRGNSGIIILSGRTDEISRITSLRAGADDVVTKPFGYAELHARIDAILRRVRPRQHGQLHIGDITIDLDHHYALHRGEQVGLTPKEFELFALLATAPGVVHRRERLFLEVWNTSWRGTSRTLDVHMATLRSKVPPCAHIETVRGVGYRLTTAGPCRVTV
jgi:DNA-binding response OmpR family regulator